MIEVSILPLSYLILPICFLIYFFHLFINDDSGIPWNWPFIGMIPNLLRSFHDMHNKIAEYLEEAGGTHSYNGIWFTNMDFLCTVDPENVRYIMSTNCANYIKGDKWKKGFDIFGDALYNSDFEAWKNNRRVFHAFLYHQEFHQSVAKIIPSQIEKGLMLVLNHVAEQGKVVDLQDWFLRYSFDLASVIVTGYNPESLSVRFPEISFSNAMNDAWEAIFSRYMLPGYLWKMQRWLQFGKEKKLSDAWKALDEIFAEYLSLQRQKLKSNEHCQGNGFNFLKGYLTRPEVTGPTPMDKLMRDNAVHMIFAIQDTNSVRNLRRSKAEARLRGIAKRKHNKV